MFPQQVSWLPFLPLGSHNKEPEATYSNTYTSTATQERRESADEGEDEEEEGREEEEEQRPLCSGVPGYPVVRDHTQGVELSGAPDAQAGDEPYKGELKHLNKSMFK